MATKKTVPPTMKIWAQVEETPISHTRQVKLGREFTAIDAQYCIMRMTELFGPVGEGWGYITETTIHTNFVSCNVSVWHGDISKAFGPYTSIVKLHHKNGSVDTDAAKKGITDALTKCLSHLGIGADIFLGKYEDNKYVAELRAKQAEEAKALGSKFSPHPDLTPEQEAEMAAMDAAHRSTIDEDL